MNFRKALLGALVASSLGAIALPANAEIVVRVAPPPPRYEAVPAPRHGYEWEAGHYRWNGHRYVWNRGQWQRARHGYSYVAPRWEERDGRWVYHSRRWDRDGDGVPNSMDRRPNNPNRS